MGRTCSLDRQIVRAFQALLLERRAKLRESVRARMAERRAGEPRRSPEDAPDAVESLGKELEVAMLDRESREAAQIDAALERLARDEYGICRSCGTVIGLGRLKALPFAQCCTACQAGVEARERGVGAEWRSRSIRPEPRAPRPAFAVSRGGPWRGGLRLWGPRGRLRICSPPQRTPSRIGRARAPPRARNRLWFT